MGWGTRSWDWCLQITRGAIWHRHVYETDMKLNHPWAIFHHLDAKSLTRDKFEGDRAMSDLTSTGQIILGKVQDEKIWGKKFGGPDKGRCNLASGKGRYYLTPDKGRYYCAPDICRYNIGYHIKTGTISLRNWCEAVPISSYWDANRKVYLVCT